jgi:hypothetical protein
MCVLGMMRRLAAIRTYIRLQLSRTKAEGSSECHYTTSPTCDIFQVHALAIKRLLHEELAADNVRCSSKFGSVSFLPPSLFPPQTMTRRARPTS